MIKIGKYEVKNEIRMYEGAQIFDIDFHGGTVCIWALINTSGSEVIRRFRSFDTGVAISLDIVPDLRYIGSVHMRLSPKDHGKVHHVFELVD